MEDAFTPSGGVVTNDAGFTRTLTLSGEVPTGLHFRAAEGKAIARQDDGRFLVDGMLRVGLESSAGDEPVIRPSGGRLELLLPLTFRDGGLTITETLSWP